MTAVEIVRRWLSENGYDGFYLDGECGCLLDDFAPCGEMGSECKAGYKVAGPYPSPYADFPDAKWHVAAKRKGES